jgi:hypothetical protein
MSKIRATRIFEEQLAEQRQELVSELHELSRYRRDREARAAMKKFYVQIQKHVEWALEIINTAERYSGALQEEMLRGTANTLEIWRRDFEQLAKKQGEA